MVYKLYEHNQTEHAMEKLGGRKKCSYVYSVVEKGLLEDAIVIKPE